MVNLKTSGQYQQSNLSSLHSAPSKKEGEEIQLIKPLPKEGELTWNDLLFC